MLRYDSRYGLMKGERNMFQFHMNTDGFQTKTAFGDLQISSQNEHGYRPNELFVASIVGCSGLTLQNILEKMRTSFTDIHVTTDIERNPDKANRLEKIHLDFTVISTNATEEKLGKALKLTIKNCAMIQSVNNNIDITETIKKE